MLNHSGGIYFFIVLTDYFLTALVIKMAILVSKDDIESHVEIERTLLSLLVDCPCFTLLG
jgi:hypothetical protein